MPNLRIIHQNQADLATSISASTTSGALVAANMKTDRKIEVHRSTGTSVTYTLTWAAGVTIGAVALPATNLSAAATMRVRLYSDTGCTALLQDSGVVTACPGLALGLWAWPTAIDANAFAYGGASKSAVWFESQQAGVNGLKVDLADAGNPAGYIDCARLVAGPWWQPVWGAEYGATQDVVDTSVNTRTLAGDLATDRGPLHEEMSLSLAFLSPAERATLMQLMRGNGVSRNVFVSRMQGAGNADEQDGMLWGKRKGAPVAHAFFDTHAHTLDLQGW